MDHLEEARAQIRFSHSAVGAEWAQYNAQLAIAYALIAIAERLPLPAETASECAARLRKEEKDGV